MFKYLMFQIKRLYSSKFVVTGKCKKCGNCCRNIVFYIGESLVKTEKQFDDLKELKKSYNHFFISGRDDDGALLFTCKSLNLDNSCKDYNLRSIACRNYPKANKKFIINGGKPLEGCGYKFEPNKKFDEYLD